MATIKLPETELENMREFYEEELDRTLKRLEHIESILKRLGGNEQPAQFRVSPARSKTAKTGTARKPGRPAKTDKAEKETAATKAKRKSGRKSKWEALIMKRMRQLNKPVTYDELTQEIMTLSKLPEGKRKSTKQAVVSVIFRLRNRDMLTSFFLCFLPILIVYYPLLVFGVDGAKDGRLPPWSVWTGNVLLLLWGFYLLRRVIRY